VIDPNVGVGPHALAFTLRGSRSPKQQVVGQKGGCSHPITTYNPVEVHMKKGVVWLSAILLAGILSACAQLQGVNSSRVAGVEGAPGSANDIATGGAGNRTASGTDSGP